MELKSRTAVITGAARGIGRAIALSFARDGANIALLDLDEQALEDTRQQCSAHGVTARAYTASVAKEEDVTRTMDCVVKDFGGLDILVNNAGIIRDALLVKAKEGAVLDKMSLAQWQAVWAKELARFNIRAAAIAPGFIATDIVSTMRPEMVEKALRSVPLGRPGTPDEVAAAAQFIVENDFFTGRCIDLDGGMRA